MCHDGEEEYIHGFVRATWKKKDQLEALGVFGMIILRRLEFKWLSTGTVMKFWI